MKRLKGAVTVEAAIVLPLYILLLAFLINFLNIFHVRLVVQNGLNNAATLFTQYAYVTELANGGVEAIGSVSEQDAAQFSRQIEAYAASAETMAKAYERELDAPLTRESAQTLVTEGRSFHDASDQIERVLERTDSDVIGSYFLSAGGVINGATLQAEVESYLREMKVNRNLIKGDICYEIFLNPENGDLLLTASYQYSDALFSAFGARPFVVRQQTAVHPWTGGAANGLRGLD